jgi:hypothetical protein
MPKNFSKSELAISYNGKFVRYSRKKLSHDLPLGKTFLTHDGCVYKHENDDWDQLVTPEEFLFYDSEECVTYLVNRCTKKIESIIPSGKIIDFTDQVLYEIQEDGWCPIYDFSKKDEVQPVIHCTHLTSSEGFNEKTSPMIPRLNLIHGQFTTSSFQKFPISFEIIGQNPLVDLSLSEILPDAVNLENGSVDPNAIPPGHSKVLVYRSQLDHKSLLVFQIFQRDSIVPTISAKYGQFIFNELENVVLPEQNPYCPDDEGNACLVHPVSDPNNLVQIGDWTSIQGNDFNTEKGFWQVSENGLYKVDIVISLCTIEGVDLINDSNPSFILVQTPGCGAKLSEAQREQRSLASRTPESEQNGVIVGQAPVNVNSKETPRTIQAVLNLLLDLKKDDLLSLYYVDRLSPNSTLAKQEDEGTLSNEGYRLIRNGTTFNAHKVN